MTYTVSRDTNIVKIVVTDAVTLEDCIRSVDGFLAEGNLRPGMQLLIDASGLKPLLSFDDLRDLAWHARKLIQGGLGSIAIIATSDLVFGLARTFSAYADLQGFTVAAFRTQENARRWLESCKLVAYSPAQNSPTARQ